MTTRDDYIAATTAGQNAAVGDRNPYYGQGILADLWRSGYNTMLKKLVTETRSTARDQ